mmetsp:Transcript_17527/g.29555  ORF Transcript_17527/g.29555 Transcript_17527/m.29555 type:complete len:115 (+) Transcript_17527:271-615(+)
MQMMEGDSGLLFHKTLAELIGDSSPSNGVAGVEPCPFEMFNADQSEFVSQLAREGRLEGENKQSLEALRKIAGLNSQSKFNQLLFSHQNRQLEGEPLSELNEGQDNEDPGPNLS